MSSPAISSTLSSHTGQIGAAQHRTRRMPCPTSLGTLSRQRSLHGLNTQALVQQRCDRDVSAQAQAASVPGLTDSSYDMPHEAAATPKTRVVILGSGWASMSLIKALPGNIRDKYDVVVVSPRNYFLYTPLLPAVAAGTMEEASIMEPVRKVLSGKGTYYEAACKSIDTVRKEVVTCFPAFVKACEVKGAPMPCCTPGCGPHLPDHCAGFRIPYDILIVGVGSVNNTFGVKGVQEHCQFFKTIEDAQRLKRRISECFERAALPNTSEEVRRQLLSFVICGGGPTGVEVAAEMHDMIQEDLAEHYPELMKDVKIRVIELMDRVLGAFDRKVGEFTAEQFARAGIELVLNTRVCGVSDGYVSMSDKAGATSDIPFGACVWATGIAMNPLAKQLQQLFPEHQTNARSVLTDGFMRVLGSNGSIWAFGDAATAHRAQDHAAELFDQADSVEDGRLSLDELQAVLLAASKEFPHLAQHTLKGANDKLVSIAGGVMSKLRCDEQQCEADWNDGLTQKEFKAVLEQLESSVRPLPPTAQVAAQQGQFLAGLLASGSWDKENQQLALGPKQGPFKYFHKGSLAYIGSDQAVMDVPKLGPLSLPPLLGHEAAALWRSYEVYAQISTSKKFRVLSDFIRTKVFGRNFSSF